MVEPFSTAAVSFLAEKVIDTLASGALDGLSRRRLKAAQEELQRQMTRGHLWAWTEDDTAAALFTYLRAAQEGAARLNLRLMAEAMCTGMMEPTFAPDAFRRHSLHLSTLSRDEIIALVGLMKAEAAPQTHGEDMNAGYRLRIAPEVFGIREAVSVDGCLQALGRTGWVFSVSLYGGLGYLLSSNFDEVRRLVDFEAALGDV